MEYLVKKVIWRKNGVKTRRRIGKTVKMGAKSMERSGSNRVRAKAREEKEKEKVEEEKG